MSKVLQFACHFFAVCVSSNTPTAVYLGIMKHNGVPVDADLMKSRQQEAEQQMQRIRNEIIMLIGDVEIGANCGTKAFED